jgi:hypothetical protein
LAARDGWQATFEANLGATYPVDVLLDKGAHTLPLEINVVGIANTERSADEFFHQVTRRHLGLRVALPCAYHRLCRRSGTNSREQAVAPGH